MATINQDSSAKYYHEFLMPDAGYSNIIKLHDKLYSGLFAPYLRVDELNAQGMSIHGHIGSLDVIEYANDVITTIEKVSF